MTDQQDLRDKIVGVLNIEGAFCGTCDREPGDSLYCKTCELVLNGYADAALAAIDVGEIRAEALRDVARVLTDALPESPSAAHTDRMKFAIGFLNASAEDPYRKEEQ